ncbi:hypothetical protein K0M31_015014 [Melipona bicolor]|uniref:Uncharacterized protein n=1 Tax=Melipona bicolor TaxID=60889 RepID=A0AA40FFY8_9HYME|nr:hypothetical protein K0M31_015014 [Melipona bicolor]
MNNEPFSGAEYDRLIKLIMITARIISIWPLAEDSSKQTTLFRRFHVIHVPSEGHALRGEHDEKELGLVLSRRSRNFGGKNDVCLMKYFLSTVVATMILFICVPLWRYATFTKTFEFEWAGFIHNLLTHPYVRPRIGSNSSKPK